MALDGKALAGLTDRQAVLDAIEECDLLGREAFLDKYGYGTAKEYFLRYKGNYYDSKAICGAALGYQHPDQGPLGNDEFSGGRPVQTKLGELGFVTSDAPPKTIDELLDRLQRLRTYKRDGVTAPHKPLLVLMACRNALLGLDRHQPLEQLIEDLARLIGDFSTSRTDSAVEPIWRLQSDGLWEVLRDERHLTDEHSLREVPVAAVLKASGTTGGLPKPVFDLVTSDPPVAIEVLDRLKEAFVPELQVAVASWFMSDGVAYIIGSNGDSDVSGVRTEVGEIRAWVVRAGVSGTNETFCLNNGVAVIGWQELPKPPDPVTVEWLRSAIADTYTDEPSAARANYLGQLTPFMTEIKPGDLIATPLKTNRGKVAIGVCTRPYYYADEEADPSQQKQIGVDWKVTDFDLSALGQKINKYFNQPRTVSYLDDDTYERLAAVVDHGSPHLYWWVNQGTSWEAEHKHGCICAPRQARNGAKFRHHLDVGRVQAGDVICHYAGKELWNVSKAISDGHESVRPYELGADLWQRDVFLADCWYDRLHASIGLAEINSRTSDAGPFNSSGGVKQGYLWPLARSFVNQLTADHEEALRGTALNPGTVWLLQANPDLDKSDFPNDLREHSESDSTALWEATFEIKTHYQQMRAGDRVLFWLSGEQAGIYATGWLATDPYQNEEIWSVDADVWWNTYNEPFLKAKLEDNPVLHDLGPIKFRNATSYEVTPEQWAEFTRLATEREKKVVPPIPREEGLLELADRLYLEPTTALQEIVELLGDRSQAIFYGPPGTGKTWVALKLADWLAGSKDRIELVQFHPSYAYEDFIEGWRPTEDGTFKLKNGPLKRLAEQAATDPEKTFVLVIDEINRANLSKVLGELFFLFEYRDEEVTLQYSEEQFSLPPNLKIIGTMNTADRSIALVDAALRRRFHFHPFFPDRPPIQGILKRWLREHRPELIGVADLVDRANELLDDRNMAIGPSHFMKADLTEDKVKQIWRRSVIPFIEDQFFDEPARVKQFTYEALIGTDTTDTEGGPGDENADPSPS
jgi:MoxR-like ATPase